jgi:hypothetical protein
MAATGFTPISLYYSATTTNTPTAGNLVAGELAINTADGRLFYKDSSNVVQVIATKDAAAGVFGAGTVSAPSITTTGDTNTGIYFPAADTIAFTEGGVEAMRIDSSGNVGIGTSSPGVKLEVTGVIRSTNGSGTLGVSHDGTNGALVSSSSLLQYAGGANPIIFHTNITERMRIDTSGNVGIGTSSPSTRLSVVSGTNAGISVNDGTINTIVYNSGTGTGSIGTTTNHPLALYSNDAERMRIDNAGNVGIGTSSPSTKVMVLGASETTSAPTNAGTKASTLLVMGGTEGVGSGGTVAFGAFSQTFAAIKGFITDASSSSIGDLCFSTRNAVGDTSLTERMRIDSAGRVGIGTSSPEANLEIYKNATECRILATGDGVAPFIQAVRYETSTTAPFFQLHKSRGSKASPSAVQTGDQVGTVQFSVYGGSNFRPAAIIRAEVENYTSDTNISGRLAFFTNSASTTVTERMRITSGGEVYIAGTTDQGAYNLQCNGTGVWGAGAYVNGSDARIKEDVEPIESGLDVVEKLNPVTYRYKEDWSKDQSVQPGFIAQELLTALEGTNYVDGVVTQGGSQGYYSVAYQNLIPILTKAIQELKAELDTVKAELNQLKGN